MTNRSDPIGILIDIKAREGFEVDDELLKSCYELQKNYQFEKERTKSLQEMKKLVEEYVQKVKEDF